MPFHFIWYPITRKEHFFWGPTSAGDGWPPRSAWRRRKPLCGQTLYQTPFRRIALTAGWPPHKACGRIKTHSLNTQLKHTESRSSGICKFSERGGGRRGREENCGSNETAEEAMVGPTWRRSWPWLTATSLGLVDRDNSCGAADADAAVQPRPPSLPSSCD